MNSFKTIIGNSNLLKNIKKSIKEKTDSHAYMIASEDTIMRREVAFAISKAMLCENFNDQDDVCGECKSCKTFDSANNLDFRVIDKGDEKNIGVDKIRDGIVNDTMYAPTENKYKIYVIDGADDMNENAQNALLKTLEEPKEYVKIFLLVKKETSMLPTILSRCVTLKMMPLNDADIKKWAYTNLDPSEDTEVFDALDYYAKYAAGNVTNLMNVIKNKEFKRIREIAIDMAIKLLSGKFDDFASCKIILNDEKDNITDILNILEIWYRDVIFAKNNLSDMIINYDKIDKVKEDAKKVSESKLENAIKKIKDYKEDISQYANYKVATEVFQINVSEV